MKKEFTPYYAVIFTSTLKESHEGYHEMAEEMERLGKQECGFLGIDSARNDIGITVSYWKSLEAIKKWKEQTEHLLAQQKGIKDWYNWYNVRICKVEREYDFESS